MGYAAEHAIFIAGPTGCGKSSVAIGLAHAIGKDRAVIVNGDAFQIYQGMEVLSAAPTAQDRAEIDHELFGILPVSESCDAASYSRLAEEKIHDLVENRSRIPIVVGGSGLYLKALTHGLGPAPPGDENLRAELEKLTLEELISRYRELDPRGAAETNLKNRRYVTRNLEISILAGIPASTLKQDFETSAPDFTGWFLTRERDDLYKRINQRTHEMFAEGVVDEVETLITTQELSPTAEKAIGLREIRDFIAGNLSKDECIEQIQQATRRYSKRQRTWFRREKGFKTIEIQEGRTAEEIAALLR